MAGGRRHSGEIPGAPGFSYSWIADETELRILHRDGDRHAVALSARLGTDGVFLDDSGRAGARLVNNAVVVVDDCQQEIGSAHEFKGTGNATLIRKLDGKAKNFWLPKRWIDQAERDVEAMPGRTIIWHFAEKEALEYARNSSMMGSIRNSSASNSCGRLGSGV